MKQRDLVNEQKQLEAMRDEDLNALVVWNLKIEDLSYKVHTEDASDANVKALQAAEEGAQRARESISHVDHALKVNAKKQAEAKTAAWENERDDARKKVEALSQDFVGLTSIITAKWNEFAESIVQAVKVEREALALSKKYELGVKSSGFQRDAFVVIDDGLWNLRPTLPGLYNLNVHPAGNDLVPAKVRLGQQLRPYLQVEGAKNE